ncbi:beta-1,3-galactosyltransferase 1-like [Biomphalaria glabrata]|uniref:Hexosyltransferase n=1 Tax=Biomphalaria glabrata TaxID=6526 RepID=A0A9W2ZCX9_BIOGL|nr:beta-1,3-galactosyltransferase 1-like [Biomphalaria glabrata]
MAFLISMRRRLILLTLIQLMTILLVVHVYTFGKYKEESKGEYKETPKQESKEMVSFSKDDPRLLLLELMEDQGHRLDYIEKHNADIQEVFHQMDLVTKENKKALLSFLSQPVINDHSFDYIHNPDRACVNSNTDVLIMVPSSPGNFQNRKNIRSGDYSTFTGNIENRAQIMFFIGLTKSNETQMRIDEESETYEDIVQESFEDVYRNIRYKSVSMLRWVSTYCREARFVIRNDDDISVNLSLVLDTVKRTREKYANFILGRVRMNDMPMRNMKDKYALSRQEYAPNVFPPFALGGLLGLTTLTAELLYQAALRVSPIWLDDVYITGICAPHVGVKLINDSSFAFKHKGKWAH